MSENQNHRLHAYITGRVQGVGFRYFTMTAAEGHNLTGWVRNLHDGRVEVLAEGKHEDLNNLLRDLRKGPMSAEVRDVKYDFSDATGEYDRFFARHTV
ncbi:MAG: acylphosphatase [Brevefilum sp.]|nr:acylphosphatase [Brevefilum sp.]